MRPLQEYFHRKNHSLLLKGAAQTLKHTLDPLPTTSAPDGLVHLGDTLMLRSSCTGGLLQADVQDPVEVNDNSRREAVGMALSCGQMLAPCARNVLTVSRVSDDDGFPDDGCLWVPPRSQLLGIKREDRGRQRPKFRRIRRSKIT